MKNAIYSYKGMTNDEKAAFEQSIKDDTINLLRIQMKKSDNIINHRFDEVYVYKKIDEHRLEELANIYSEIKNENSDLAEKVRHLAGLMVIESGTYFVTRSNVINMYRKYPDDCSLGEMWCVFVKCFESFDKDYIPKKKNKTSKSKKNKNDDETCDRFIAYFKNYLKDSFKKIYNKREKEIVLESANNVKLYGETVRVDKEITNKNGDSYQPQIEDSINNIDSYDTINAKAYLFSNLITNIMVHLGTDGRKANKATKRMFRAFYTGDTIAFAKCEGLDIFYNAMCSSQNKILNSCLDDFFEFILRRGIPKSIEQVRYAEIKTYKELNSSVFKMKAPEESPLLYIPTEQYNEKRFGFENLVYVAFSNTSKGNISGQIKKYDDFRNKYFFKCEI